MMLPNKNLLDTVPPYPPDPIFKFQALYKKDTRPQKMDLTVGTFKNTHLQTELLKVVRSTEANLPRTQRDKAYLPIDGDPLFLKEARALLFPQSVLDTLNESLCTVQTIGGTGALSLGTTLLASYFSKKIYIPNPTWANHNAIFNHLNMEILTYPYTCAKNGSIDFQAIVNTLEKGPEYSTILFHPSSHNPTGLNLNASQWAKLSAICKKKHLFPFFDIAYHGLGNGLKEDVMPIHLFAQAGHAMNIAYSFSKNFTLYAERVGALHIIVKNPQIKQNLTSHLKQMIRTQYSNPPAHGAAIVRTVLSDSRTFDLWEKELLMMRNRMIHNRTLLSKIMKEYFSDDVYRSVKTGSGLFALLPLSKEQIYRLMHEHAIYLTEDGRINLTGFNDKNFEHLIEGLVKTR